MKLLITGGTGFIGSHTAIELLEQGYDVVILDNLSNSQKEVVKVIEEITKKKAVFYEGDVCDKTLLESIFKEHKIDAVIHFAGYKAVGESVKQPLKYYDNNLISTIHLLEVMEQYNCKKLVFSSSATVYGNPKTLPIKEDFPLSTTNPYGTTKLFIEQMLQDISAADASWSIANLRYFNPIGAHESGLLGESPNSIPNNLMPYIVKVAAKELDSLQIFGNDYPTPDGTGVRDYIHVVDLAHGHLKALEYLTDHTGIEAFNLGTGTGYSVLDVLTTFSKVNHVEVPYQIVQRREGDIPSCYADSSKAEQLLGFKTTKSLEEMCKDAYHFIEVQNKMLK